MMIKGHQCPGDCGREVEYWQVVCQPDWRRLPDEIRERVKTSWSQHVTMPRAYMEAWRLAYQWLWSHPDVSMPVDSLLVQVGPDVWSDRR